MSLRGTLLAVVFMGFLTPVLYGELTVNYSFALLPPLVALARGKICKAPRIFSAALILYTLIYWVSIIGQADLYETALRRTTSYVLFMTYFSYIFIAIDEEMIATFKAAIVGIGLVFSATKIYTFFAFGGGALDFAAKDLVGDQRFGAVYLLGAWLTYFYTAKNRVEVGLKCLFLCGLMAGLLLTFSRGTIVALLGSAALFVVVRLTKWLVRADMRDVLKAGLAFAAVVAMTVLLRALLPTTFDFFQERLFELENSQAELTDPTASAGIRVAMAKQIFSYVEAHPLTGSGYLGVWILPDTPEGVNSAHNQYTDILFRTGYFGFLVFCCLLFWLLRHFYVTEQALFWGLVGILICMIFHDIFKESEGAFILAFFFGLLAQSLRGASNRGLKGRSISAVMINPPRA